MQIKILVYANKFARLQNGQYLKARFCNQLLNIAHFDRTFDWAE